MIGFARARNVLAALALGLGLAQPVGAGSTDLVSLGQVELFAALFEIPNPRDWEPDPSGLTEPDEIVDHIPTSHWVGIVVGLSADPGFAKKVRITCHWEIWRRDGKLYRKGTQRCFDRRPDPAQDIEFTDFDLAFRPDPGDPIGTYRILIHAQRQGISGFSTLELTLKHTGPKA